MTNKKKKNKKKSFEMMTEEEKEKKEDDAIRAEVRAIMEKKQKEDRNKKRKIRQEKIKITRLMLMGGVKPDDAWDYSSEQTGLFKLNDFVTSSELAQFLEEKKTVLLPEKKKKQKNRERRQTQYFEDSEQEIEAEEAELDAMYQVYKQRRHIRSKNEEKN